MNVEKPDKQLIQVY